MKTRKPLLIYDGQADYAAWKEELRAVFTRLLGDLPERRPCGVVAEYTKKRGGYTEIRFSFLTEEHARVPCHLLLPETKGKKLPLIITLQGHGPGMSQSLDESSGSAYGLYAVKRGYAALVMEQRCFGERACKTPMHFGGWCDHTAAAALLIGRTMAGERAFDISRAIDSLAAAGFPEIDMERIAVMGHSGGGTAAFYAACIDDRIKIVMPSCSFCSYIDSIGTRHHCVCNYIPGALKYFDMGDLAALISPRALIAVCGDGDEDFPLSGSEKAFETAKKIYAREGKPDLCSLVVGKGGHDFYADAAYREFNVVAKRLNW